MVSIAQVDWEDFINENLISKELLSGVCLLSHQGVDWYSYGILNDLQIDWSDFPKAFKQPTTVLVNGLHLKIGSEMVNYRVYNHTYCSMYATAPGGCDGLIACNLPYGILVCTYHRPHQAHTVVKAVENFCDRLRA